MAVTDYDPIIEAAAKEHDVDPNWVRSVMHQESGGNAMKNGKPIVGTSGERGLMQLMPETWNDLGVTDPDDPVQNIWGGVKHLAQLRDQFKGNIPLATAAYNAGAKRVGTAVAQGQQPANMASYVGPVGSNYKMFAAKNTAAPATAAPDNSDLIQQLMPATSAPAATPAAPDNSDLIKQLQPAERAAAATEAAPQTVRDQVNAALQPGGALGGFTPEDKAAFDAGFKNSGRGVGIGINRLIGDPLGMLPGQTANRDAFKAQYGDNPTAQMGQTVGSTLATLPIMAAVNPLVSRIAGAGVNALGSVAPGLAARAAAASDFLGGSFGGATATTPARPLISLLSNAANGGLQGAEAAAINSGQSDQPLSTQMLQGAAMGAPMAALPAAAGYAKNALTGASGSLDPEIAKVAQIARDQYGVQLKAPQLGLNPTLGYLNSTLKFVPGSGVGADEAATQAQFNRAVAQEMGESTDKIHGTTIASALKRSGKVMNDVGSRTSLDLTAGTPGATPLDQLANVESAAQQPISGLNESQIKQVQSHINKIQDIAAANGGVIPGPTYLNLIKKGEALDNLVGHESPTMAGFGSKIRNALDDALQASATPDDAAALQQARYQYKVAKTVEPLTARSDAMGGPRPSIGDINPVALRAAVLNPRAFGPDVTLNDWGRTPLWDLAKIGQYMKEAPQSGTAPREAIQNALFSLGRIGAAGAMGGAGYAGAAIPGVLGGLVAGVTAGRATSAALRSQTLANRLINSSVNPLAYYTQVDPMARSALAALAGPRANQLPTPYQTNQ